MKPEYEAALRQELTERKKTEDELIKSLSMLKATLEATADGILVIDKKFRICRYNQKYLDMWGLSDDILNVSITNEDFTSGILDKVKKPGYYAEMLTEVWENPQGEHSFRFEMKDGRIFERYSCPQWFKDKVIGRVVSFRDITKYQMAEQALKESGEKYRVLVDNAKDAIVMTTLSKDGLPERILEMNDIACQWMGVTKAQALALTPEQLVLAALESGILPRSNLQQHQRKTYLYETIYMAPDGRQIPIEMNIHRFKLNGQMVSLGVARDLTERRKMEREMARLDRLNLVGEMAAGIGHEVRNPMTTVRGFLQMLSNKPECVDYHHYYRIMIEELDRANSIISEFLSLAKDKAILRQSMNLNQVVNALVPLIEADALVNDKNVILRLGNVPDLMLDEKEIRQLILNLARNGLEAMQQGGCITIQTYEAPEQVTLAVSDQGEGIDKAILDKVGTPFFTTKENGTGLGLAVCYSIAARHNARIDVKTSSKGTTFYVNFKRK